jgi:hypothetical protein
VWLELRLWMWLRLRVCLELRLWMWLRRRLISRIRVRRVVGLAFRTAALVA